jgi:small glutamine-rich tetratricopeptide repeat-containing protein alpha
MIVHIVAIQSIEEAFGIDMAKDQMSIKPNDLQKIFNVFVQTKQAAKPVAPTTTAATPKPNNTELAEELKKDGNKLLAAKDYEGAIKKYSEAIALDDQNAVYFANRAAAYSQAGKHDLAAQDAKQALHVNPDYSKAYSRLGHAEFCLGNYQEAISAYEKGLDKEPTNANLKQSLAAAQAKWNESSPSSSRAAPSNGGVPDFGSMMNDPNFMNMGIRL